ncbi:MAG TPA: hypothetical protein DGT23_02695 [Micromonosporaceae bacterium]|nr:hypothetical protein [Micromonosporaceae bacterium]
MLRLLSLAAALVAIVIPGTAVAAPVSPTPSPSATFDGPVHSAAYLGNVIYVGGNFNYATVNGQRIRRTRLAALDARTGALLNWTPSADGVVTAIAADSTGVYIAGDFQYVSSSKRDSLAKLDPITGKVRSGFNHRISGHPHTIAVGHGRVYLGGTITSVGGVARSKAAAFDAATGALDQGWAPVVDDVVRAILPASDRVFLAGRFGGVNWAEGTQKLAAVTPDTAAVLSGFVSRVHTMVHKLTLANGTLYAGIDGNGGKAMAMNAATGSTKWTVSFDGDPQAIAVLDDTVYIGGHFDWVCASDNLGSQGGCLDGSYQRIKLAAFNLNGDLLSWTANGNGTVGVYVLLSHAGLGQVLAGGEFTMINGSTQPRFALFNLAT